MVYAGKSVMDSGAPLILRLFLLFLLSKSSACACNCVKAEDRLSCSLDKSLNAIASCLFSSRSVREPRAAISWDRVEVDFLQF